MINKALKTIIVLFLLVTPLILKAQVRIGDFGYNNYRFNDLNKKDLDRFLGKKTTFVLPEIFSKEDYDQLLKEVWDITPYTIILSDDFNEDTIKEDDVLAIFESKKVEEKTKRGTFLYYYYHFIDFHVVDKVKEKRKEKVWTKSRVAAIYFTPNSELRRALHRCCEEFEVYENLENFKLAYLKNYLQLVNNSLKTKSSIDIYDDFESSELRDLQNNILYVDANFVSSQKYPTDAEIFSDYSFEYKVIEYENLKNKILDEKEDFYYLIINIINGNKIINVVNGKTGNIIYQQHTLASSYVKPKDLKKLNSRIIKLNKK